MHPKKFSIFAKDLRDNVFLNFQVNNVDFANIIREEAVLFLLDLPKGEEVTILAQKKKDGKLREKNNEKLSDGLV